MMVVMYLGDLLHLERVLDLSEVGRVAHARMMRSPPLRSIVTTVATTLIDVLFFSGLLAVLL